MNVAGLVLAAGEGRRFGGPKALASHGGQRLVDRAVGVLRDGGCEPIVVVSGAAALDVPGAAVVHNPGWAEGLGSSLRVGLAWLPADADAVAIVLVDQPAIGAESVRRLRAALDRGAQVAVATYEGQRGHPVLFARGHWDEVARMATGDSGARAFMRAYPELVVEVPCDDTGSAVDVDTPEDLSGLANRVRAGVHGNRSANAGPELNGQDELGS
jgi:nicotine blue oxidoreductase